METLQLLFSGFASSLTPTNILMTAGGGILGIQVGAMPGIGSLLGCALLLPLTFKMNPTTAIIMLAAIYYGNMYGGAYSAILLNIPGDSPAITTALDGYPMAKKGRPGQALMAANTASFIGGTIGIIILTITASGLAKLGLNFGYAEMTLVLLIAMTSISWLIGENPTKGVVITMLGILVASIGMDTLTSVPRYNFGSIHLMGGVTFTPFIIGAVGFAQVIKLINEREADEEKRSSGTYHAVKLSIRGSMLTKLPPVPWWATPCRRSSRARSPWAPAPSKALPLPRPATTPPLPARSLLCWLWASPVPAPARSCWAA